MRRNKYQSTFGTLQNKISNITHLDKYFKLFKSQNTLVSDEVYNDLNLENFFHYANRCVSPIGEMLLYYKLRHLSRNTNAASSEEVISNICDSEDIREQVESTLMNLSKGVGYSVADLLDIPKQLSKWHQYMKYLPAIYALILILLLIFGQISSLILVAVLILLVNSLIHYWNKVYVDVHIRPLIQLSKLKSTAFALSQIDKWHDTKDIKDSINAINKLEKRYFTFGLNKYLESELALIFSAFIDIIKIAFLVEPIMTNNIACRDIESKLHSKRLIEYIGEWDVLFSIASLRTWLKENELAYSIPTFTTNTNHSLVAEAIYNPLVENCVTNDVNVNNTVIITGSNMSGKSTFLRTIGLNIVSSYALNTCYASSIHLSSFNLHTILSVSDDIVKSKSYYLSEVERIKAAIDVCSNSTSGSVNMVLIDEIFKGTNTAERISIANAVIKYFIKLKNTIAIVTTHDVELANSFDSLLDIYHFDESINSNQIYFDYKLKPGLEYNRNAISLLKYYHYPAEIISCAEENVNRIKDSFNVEL